MTRNIGKRLETETKQIVLIMTRNIGKRLETEIKMKDDQKDR